MTPGSAIRLISVARHVTNCATRPGQKLENRSKRKQIDLLTTVFTVFFNYMLFSYANIFNTVENLNVIFPVKLT